jgi:sugar/nucleoside kinase (ribokinase family)
MADDRRGSTSSRTDAVDIVSMGEAFEDLVFHGLSSLPAAGREVRTQDFARTFGGGTIITAVAAARLGTRVVVMSAMADEAVVRLRAEGVRARNLRRLGEAHAITVALSTMTDRGFATFDGVNDRLEERLLARLDRLPRARHVHLALVPRDLKAWISAMARLRRRGVTTSWDFGWSEALTTNRLFPALLGGPDWVFVNDLEARAYSGRRTITSAVPRWRTLARGTVIKRGAQGALAVLSDGVMKVPAPRAAVVDTTGAGDAFNGGFLSGLVRGHRLETCLRLGSLVGSASTRKAGGLDGLPHVSEMPAWARTALGRR